METHLNDLSQKPFVPWNKRRVTGQKPPLKPREVWLSACGCRYPIGFATWRCSISPSTTNCVAVIWFTYASKTSCKGIRCVRAPWFPSAGRVRRYNSRSPSKHAPRSRLALEAGPCRDRIGYSRAGVDKARPMTTRQYGRLVDEWIAAIGPI